LLFTRDSLAMER